MNRTRFRVEIAKMVAVGMLASAGCKLEREVLSAAGGAGHAGGGSGGDTSTSGGGMTPGTSGGGTGNPGASGAGAGGESGVASWEVPLSAKLDLLFLIDNSSSTRDKQTNLLCSFPRFLDILSKLPMGLPDLHIGVVSSDMGSGALSIPSCGVVGGDDGVFQSLARPQVVSCQPFGGGALDTTGCSGPNDGKSWIRYHNQEDNNIGGQDLSKAFACIAALGDTGCGFEAQLAAVRRALQRAANPMDRFNGGFLRPDAKLGIILLTDEDDCSLPPDSMLGDTSDGTDLTSPLGPLVSFRCTERGVLCNGQRPPRGAAANLQGCQSNETAYQTDPLHSLLPVAQLIADIQALKPPGMTVVEAIAGPAPPDGQFAIETSVQGGGEVPVLAASCTGGPSVGSAAPAVRIQQFLRGWDADKKVVSICQPSFADVLSSLIRQIGVRYNLCLPRPPLDTEGRITRDPSRADCRVTDVQRPGQATECHVDIARCGTGPTTVPGCLQGAPSGYASTCWYVATDTRAPDGTASCPQTGMEVRVCRNGFDPGSGTCRPGAELTPPDANLRVRCAG